MKSVKAQALVAVLLILALVGIFAGALGTMWEGELKTRTLERDGMQAFFLAQAGMERAKTWVSNNIAATGCFPSPCAMPRTWFSLGANQEYRFEVTDLGSFKRRIESYGRVMDAISGQSLAEKAMQVEVEGIGDGPGCGGGGGGGGGGGHGGCDPNDKSDDKVTSGTWREF